MIIYEFSTFGAKPGELYSITPHKVAEKPKIYMGGGMRVNKDEIDILNTSCGMRRMFRLDDNPEPFITAMIEYYEKEVEKTANHLRYAKSRLSKWEGVKK